MFQWVGLTLDDLVCGVGSTERELFWCHSGPLSGMLVVELLRWGSGGGQIRLGGVSGLELLGRGSSMGQCWLPLVLGLEQL